MKPRITPGYWNYDKATGQIATVDGKHVAATNNPADGCLIAETPRLLYWLQNCLLKLENHNLLDEVERDHVASIIANALDGTCVFTKKDD